MRFSTALAIVGVLPAATDYDNPTGRTNEQAGKDIPPQGGLDVAYSNVTGCLVGLAGLAIVIESICRKPKSSGLPSVWPGARWLR